MRPRLPDPASRTLPKLFCALGIAMTLAAPVRAETPPETLKGEARVIDADILIVAGRIDPPKDDPAPWMARRGAATTWPSARLRPWPGAARSPVS